VAKGFDDRAGCVVLLEVIGKIDPSKLNKKITFCWSIEEEIALTGAKPWRMFLRMQQGFIPVDTFVLRRSCEAS